MKKNLLLPLKKIKFYFHHFQSIKTSILFWFFLIIMTALLTFLIISLRYTHDTLIGNSTEYTSQLVKQVNSDIDSYIQYMKNISMMFTKNSDVSSYLFADLDDDEKSVRKAAIVSQFETLIKARTDIRNIGIYQNEKIYILNNKTCLLNPDAHLEAQEWYMKTLQANGGTYLSNSHIQNIIEDRYNWVITLSNTLTNYHTGKNDGILFIDLNYNTIQDLCDKISLGKKGYVFILDESGNILYHPKQQLLFSSLKSECIDKITSLPKGQKYFIQNDQKAERLYTVSTSNHTGWTVVGVAYLAELNRNEAQTRVSYILLAGLLTVIAFFISSYLSKEITLPIKMLQTSMSKVEEGHFETAIIPGNLPNEIGSLNHSFNVMIQKIQSLIIQNTEEQRQKRKSELKALQAQINPHFLYNTLDSIIWMAETGQDEDVVLMTSSLAKLLRQSISNEEEQVRIRQEVEYTRSYLTIQKMRYKDMLNFYIDVDEAILDQKIVKLTLQPIAENAIYHGVKFKENKGNVWIKGLLLDEDIILTVTDDGVGMTKEELSTIFEKKQPKKKSNGVGINNVQSRLHLYYGPDYGLSIESEVGLGTTVIIKIPHISEDEERNRDL